MSLDSISPKLDINLTPESVHGVREMIALHAFRKLLTDAMDDENKVRDLRSLGLG